MKKSELLKEAKKFLMTPDETYNTSMIGVKEKYVCVAIDRAARCDGGITSATELKHWIQQNLLEGMSQSFRLPTLEVWLDKRHPEFIQTRKSMQKLRHMWLDWMITFWVSKGE